MTLSLTDLLPLAWSSVFDPRGGARAIKAVALPRGARWEALLLIVILGVVLGHLSILITAGDVTVLIDPESQAILHGTTIDYVTGLEGSGFVFNNPNASSSCGCGKSFC